MNPRAKVIPRVKVPCRLKPTEKLQTLNSDSDIVIVYYEHTWVR